MRVFKKNAIFAHEKSVLLISAEHSRMEKLAGFHVVTYQANIFVSLLFSMGKKK